MFWVLVSAMGLAALPAAATACQYYLDRRDARRVKPPGRLVPVQGRRMHILEAGSGPPTVVFDSAMGGTALSWEWVQPEVARLTATASYDRAGFGWSDAGPSPRNVDRCVQELHSLLQVSGATPPYILVGHSYGGFTARMFAHRYPELTAGLVLVDAADTRQWTELADEDRRKIENGSRLARRGVWVARFGLARFVIWLGGKGAMMVARKAGSWLSRGTPPPAQDRLLAPLERVSAPTRRALRWFWTRPGFYRALACQIEHVPASARAVARTGPFGDLPLSVISAPNPDPRWLPAQRSMTRLSTRGRHVTATGSSHWIPLDRPDLVASVICRMVQTVREGNLPPASDFSQRLQYRHEEE